MIEATSKVEANRLLAEADMFVDVEISEVVYDPTDHPDLVFETPWANQYPKPKLKAAGPPIIDSVPEFVPNRHGRTYTNISSQAGLSSFVGGSLRH